MDAGGGGKGGGLAVTGGGGDGKVDPSNLQLKKELTQIRKVARALRDPGTTSSWRSPVHSARSLHKHQHLRRHKNGHFDGNASVASPDQFLPVQSSGHSRDYSGSNYNYCGNDEKGSLRLKEKENRVFLYNWRTQRSESEASRQIGEDEIENSLGIGSNSIHESGNESKSDGCLSERYASAILKCKDANFTQSIKRVVKKKGKRGSNYSSSILRQHNENVQKQAILPGRNPKNGVEGLPGLGLRRGESLSLVDPSDDTEDYSNSEDLRRELALSPLLARLKQKGLPRSKAKVLTGLRKEDDSVSYSTPALSTSSYNRYGVRNPSVGGSWDAATGSFNDADDEVDDQLDLPGRQGCGISCWSRRSTPTSLGGYGSCCSPSLSDTLRRKGSSIFCGRHYLHRRGNSLGSNKMRFNARTESQHCVPLLSNGTQGSSMVSDDEDELSANFEELDLEGLSRLDGRRWSSSCRSQDAFGESSPENSRSLSHKHKPMCFDDLIGQGIVVQSLRSAVSRGRIAPIYLFQGARGTGKSSTARIFAAALNCHSTDDSQSKPCGACRQCTDLLSGKTRYLIEVDGSNKKGIISNLKNLSKTLSAVHSSQYTVFVINECHLLPSKTWLTFLQLLEKPLPRVVFILVTADVDNLPRTVLSRCQKHVFNKISSGDIVARLVKIVNDEKLDVEPDALELIASNADGSLRDAETMLDQLSLFGKRITISLVNELIGVVSEEKLLDLLELAMSSNATETVLRARELLDSGVDPIVLMSQLATLIVDIIAGIYPNVDEKHNSFLVSERELERLRHALSLLSEAEKHLRVSNERSTWFTATLLQLGSMPSPDRSLSGSSRRQSSKATTTDDHTNTRREAIAQKQRKDTQLTTLESGSRKSHSRSSHRDSASKDNTGSRTDDSNPGESQSNVGNDALTDSKGGKTMTTLRCVNSKVLIDIWLQCIKKCHSKTLRELLHSHGRLVSISEAKEDCVVYVAFVDRNVKTRAEGFVSSITNALETVLQKNVEVKIILLPDCLAEENVKVDLDKGDPFKPVPRDIDVCHLKEGNSDAPMRPADSVNQEQRLETAWVQAIEKGTPGSVNWSKPERNQVSPQGGTSPQNKLELESVNSVYLPSQQQQEDEMSHRTNGSRATDGRMLSQDQVAKGIDHCPISPSLLHNSNLTSNYTRDNMGYESGTGATGCLCWKNTQTAKKVKAKHGTHLRARKKGRFSWFGPCGKSSSRRDNTRYRR